MDIDIISEDENPMLHRKDVRFELQHEEATPSRLSVRDSLAAKLNKDSTEVVVRKLDTKFGMRKTLGSARVYDDANVAREIEHEYMLERNKITTDGAENGEEASAEDEEDEEEEAAEEPSEEADVEADEAAEEEADEEEAAEEEAEEA